MQGAAGSSRADGRADMSRAAELLAEELNTPVHHGFVAAIDPKFHEVVAEHQPKFAATYLLAEGFFAGKMRRDAESTGVPVKVAAPLVNAQGGASAARGWRSALLTAWMPPIGPAGCRLDDLKSGLVRSLFTHLYAGLLKSNTKTRDVMFPSFCVAVFEL